MELIIIFGILTLLIALIIDWYYVDRKCKSLSSEIQIVKNDMREKFYCCITDEDLRNLKDEFVETAASEIARLEGEIYAIQKQISKTISVCNTSEDCKRVCVKDSKRKKTSRKSKKEET